ncbi:MAG: DUF4382 domain-containing protein [Cyanobacteria bacterium P01_H01_bin.15]
MKKIAQVGLSLFLLAGVVSCGGTSDQESSSAESGTLILEANGEDFVRQGFVTKDGWDMQFEHVFVNFAIAKAHQSDPPFAPEGEDELQSQTTIELVEAPQIVDLASGDESAPPIQVQEVTAPLGTYNALTWSVEPANDGEMGGISVQLVGIASKDDVVIPFQLNLSDTLSYSCGAYVGDERKGYLESADTPATVEATFHFDHIFGDAELDATDELNEAAIGFAALAELATEEGLTIDQGQLAEQLPPDVYAKLADAIANLGHVGEGHCRLEP